MVRQRRLPDRKNGSPAHTAVQRLGAFDSRKRKWLFRLFMVGIAQVIVIYQIPNLTILGILDSPLPASAAELQLPTLPQSSFKQTTTTVHPTITSSSITARVAYVITISSCNWELIEAAAVHGHAIDTAHGNYSNHTVNINATTRVTILASHSRHAMVHPDAQKCIPIVNQVLQYQTHLRDVPLDLDTIQSPMLRKMIDADDSGCCGAKELLKLYAYTLEEYDVVIHLDTDVLVFRPPWDVIADMLLEKTDGTLWSQMEPPKPPDSSSPKVFNMTTTTSISSNSSTRPTFFFTRDYLAASNYHHNPDKFAVQGGMFLLRPSRAVFDDLIRTIQRSKYASRVGWGGEGFGGYWGAPQIQGLLSYYYYYPQKQGMAVELNRCYYNNMGAEQPRWIKVFKKAAYEGQCTTTRPTCQDCRTVPLSDIVFAHFTICSKPWHCSKWVTPDPTNLCFALHRAWFLMRESLERQEFKISKADTVSSPRIRWPMQHQSRRGDRPFWSNATMSYCEAPITKTGRRPKRGMYHSLVLYNISSLMPDGLPLHGKGGKRNTTKATSSNNNMTRREKRAFLGKLRNESSVKG